MKAWSVQLNHQAYKQLRKLPSSIQDIVAVAIEALEAEGPNPALWDSKQLSTSEYRIRLNYRYRMKYKVFKNEVHIDIFYVGTREGAYK